MNLTSKRMLQFIAGCAGVCALSASATTTTWVADTFEATDQGTLGQLIGTYKQVVTGAQFQNTNCVWVAASGDASAIAANVGSYTGTRPVTNDDSSAYVLNLSTEGQTLTRNLGVTNDFLLGDPVYVDTLIKFTPSEDNPTISDANVKAAVFVNVASNLVVYSGTESSGSISTDVGMKIDPSQWYRLTIKLGAFAGNSVAGFQVFVNGSAITNMAAYMDDGVTHPGTWFINPSANSYLSAVAFQGTGMVDDLAVSSMANGFGTPAAILLTLSFGADIRSVLTNGAPALTGAVVPTGTEVAINAAPWYHLNAPVPAGASVFNQTFTSDSTKTGTITSATSDSISFSAAINQVTVSYNPTYLTSAVGNGSVVNATSAFSIAPVASDERHVGAITGGSVTSGHIYGANGATVAIAAPLNQLTVTFDSGMTATDGGTISSPATVSALDTVAVAAKDWNRLNGKTGTASWTGTASGKTASGTIKGVDGATLAFSSAAATAGDLTALSAYGSNAGKIIAWAAANGNKTEQQMADNSADWLKDYLMNVSIGTDAKPVINSIVIGDADATITVGATSGAVDFTNLNGKLTVETADDLSGSFTVPASSTFTNTAVSASAATFKVTGAQFIKAVVQ